MNAFTDGETYERLMGRWSRSVGVQFLDWLDLPKGLRWLDVGCGNGAFTEVLAAHVTPSELTGVDPSKEQIAFAKIREGAKLAQFRVGDAQALPFSDGSFEVAIMALVISFVPDPAKAVSEMARVVRPGGMVAAYMWDSSNSSPHGPLYATMSALGFPIASRSNNASRAQHHALPLGAGWDDVNRDSHDRNSCHVFRFRRFLGFQFPARGPSGQGDREALGSRPRTGSVTPSRAVTSGRSGTHHLSGTRQCRERSYRELAGVRSLADVLCKTPEG